MRSILHKILGASGASDETEVNASLLLPPPVSTEDLHENQRRALIGWLASRMGKKIHPDRLQSGGLIYLSFASHSQIVNPDDESQYLLYLASCLVEWIGNEEDVYLKIKEMGLRDKYHRCLLETYEEVKRDIGRYIFAGQSSEKPGHSGEDQVWQVYRDVIYAATQRKFLLIRRNEVDRYKEGRTLCEAFIKERSDIPRARDLAKQALCDIGVPQTAIMSQLLVISEAVTNVLKHALEGKVIIVETGSAIHVVVEDKGPGFPLKLLPNAVLMDGYSTKKSLGQGFTLMMKMTELIVLSTIPDEGSVLILVFKRGEGGHGHGKFPAAQTVRSGNDPENVTDRAPFRGVLGQMDRARD